MCVCVCVCVCVYIYVCIYIYKREGETDWQTGREKDLHLSRYIDDNGMEYNGVNRSESQNFEFHGCLHQIIDGSKCIIRYQT